MLEGGRVRTRETHPQEDGPRPGPVGGHQTQNGQRPRHPGALDLTGLRSEAHGGSVPRVRKS